MVRLMEVKGVPILQLHGRFDAQAVPAVRSTLASVIDVPVPTVVIDLSAVSFIDSAALALLVATRRACLSGGGALALCGMSPSVRLVFELTQLLPLFPHYAHLPEAVNALTRTAMETG